MKQQSPASVEAKTSAVSPIEGVSIFLHPLAINPQKVLLAIEEKAASKAFVKNSAPSIKIVKVNIFNGENYREPYMSINPSSTVPVTVIRGSEEEAKTLTQTFDQLAWIEQEWGGVWNPQGVDGNLAQTLTKELHNWEFTLYAPVDPSSKPILQTVLEFRMNFAKARKMECEKAGRSDMVNNYSAKIKGIEGALKMTEDKASLASLGDEIKNILDKSEKLLATHPSFVAGGSYSMPDVLLTTILFNLGTVSLLNPNLNGRPKLKAYYKRMQARPSFKKVFGPASTLSTMMTVLPAIMKAKWCKMTGNY